MAQHDYNIGDQNGFDFLVDLNNALSAIATNNAGSFEPNTTFAHMLWFDTNNDLMKVRNEANSAWVVVAKKEGSGWTPYRQGTALGTASVQPDNRYVHRTNNLNDIESRSRARANLRVIEDSSDPDFTNDPDRAARRGLVLSALSNLLNASGSAPLFACRAWVNFSGTGTGGDSGNVSSITDNGVGDYTVNFTTAMQDANYAANISHGFNRFPNIAENDTHSFQRVNGAAFFRFMIIESISDQGLDADVVMVSIFR
jgi:hypothetical protein